MESSSRSATSLSTFAAEEIRVLLVRRKMKQIELATRLGQNEMWISRRLRGVQPITLDELAQIAEVLGVYPADLLPRSSEGRLITTAAPRSGTGSGTNDRSSRLSDWPRTGGHTSRTPRPSSTTRPSRLRAAHA